MTPPFLTEEEVHIIHEEALQAFGGQNGVRSESLLKSAKFEIAKSGDR